MNFIEENKVEPKEEDPLGSKTMKGVVWKTSKHLGTTRKRMLVLEDDCLKSYKGDSSSKPTETIQLSRSSVAKADGNKTGVFRLSLGTGQERRFTAESDEAAQKWVDMINESSKYAGLQGAILKKNEDVERLRQEIMSLEGTLKNTKTKMEKQTTKHQEVIEELTNVYNEELARLGADERSSVARGTLGGGSMDAGSADEEVNINDWVRIKTEKSKSDKSKHELVGIIRYIGNGPNNWKELHYGIETVDGCLGTNDGSVDALRYFQCPKKAGLFVKRSDIIAKDRKYLVGDTIELDNQRTAVVRYVGRVKTSAVGETAYRFGIELIGEANGNHNGKVGGIRYFKCPAKRGLMVPRSRIVRVIKKHRDKVFSNVQIGQNAEANPSFHFLLNKLKVDLEKLDLQVVLPSSRATLAGAHTHLDQLAQSLRRHMITGVQNRLAFDDDLQEMLNNRTRGKEIRIGLASFECRGLHDMTQSDAKRTLQESAECIEEYIEAMASSQIKNVKSKGSPAKNANKITVKSSGAAKFYHFADFNHRFYLLMPRASKDFAKIAANLVAKVKEAKGVSLAVGFCLYKEGETRENFELRCENRLEKDREAGQYTTTVAVSTKV